MVSGRETCLQGVWVVVLGAQPGHGARHAVPEQVLTVQLGWMAKRTGAQGDGAHRISWTSRTRHLPHRQCRAKQESRTAFTGTLGIAL